MQWHSHTFCHARVLGGQGTRYIAMQHTVTHTHAHVTLILFCNNLCITSNYCMQDNYHN